MTEERYGADLFGEPSPFADPKTFALFRASLPYAFVVWAILMVCFYLL